MNPSVAKVPTPDPLVVTLTMGQLRELVADAVVEALAEYHAGRPPQPTLLRGRDVCQRAQISKATLSRLVALGMPFLLAGEERRFRWSDVEHWLEERSKRRAA